MNDEKKYNEALERARKLYEQGTITESLCYVFPELKESKESDDERIRKELLEFIKNDYTEGWIPSKKQKTWIAWLEKQGEQKSTLPKWKYKKDNTPLLRDSLILNKYGCVAKSPSGALVSDVWVIDYDELAKLPKEEIEKQGEKKPADKTEPKFKVGDWVIGRATNNEPRQISEITDQYYKSTYGGQYGFSFEDEMHLWTIQDAKKGDVLSYRDGQWIFIYKEKIDDSSFYYHTLYSTIHQDLTINDSAFTLLDDAIIPATKKQRYLLFQKMKESGYEWDAEKKELKKIEQKHTEDVDLPEFESYLCLMFQKFRTKGICTNGEIVDYVEEHSQKLKDILVKPALSEEDENNLNSCISKLEIDMQHWDGHGKTMVDGDRKLISWLKSIRPKSQWKPSDEQMDALHYVTNFDYGGYKATLVSLYEQLKRLKE